MARDHGGNLDAAIRRFGGVALDWIDLSTGINRVPYPVPHVPPQAWQALPTRTDMDLLRSVAARAYATRAEVVPLAGAQAAIQAVPFLAAPGTARVLTPTYNEHAACLRAFGWTVEEVATPDALHGADLAVVVTPNNPDGRVLDTEAVAALSEQVGLLVVDESFGDATPDACIAPDLHRLRDNVVVLRSFGKFYGLAGLRLGFALATGPLAERLKAMAGPWPVSGPAIEIACTALADTGWQAETIARLDYDCAAMDALAMARGWPLVGGCPLFRTYAVPDAVAAQDRLAQAHVWSRVFPYSATWLRLGLPGSDEWPMVEAALR